MIYTLDFNIPHIIEHPVTVMFNCFIYYESKDEARKALLNVAEFMIKEYENYSEGDIIRLYEKWKSTKKRMQAELNKITPFCPNCGDVHFAQINETWVECGNRKCGIQYHKEVSLPDREADYEDLTEDFWDNGCQMEDQEYWNNYFARKYPYLSIPTTPFEEEDND